MSHLTFLDTLEEIIASRLKEKPEGSYTARLAERGIDAAVQKLGEEAVEVVLAAVRESDARLVAESADLVFHLMLVLELRGLGLNDVVAELAARHK
jgi:phosphoribosyl-ATP pyrophosphohydrolase/phosphoribosyl-AMP cyclohydrolase